MLTKFRLKLAFNRLQRDIQAIEEDATADDLLNFLYADAGSLITPWQFREELSGLVQALSDLKPKNALEIGTANGGTLFLLCRLAHHKANLMSIDLPEGPFGGGYPEWKTELYQSFAKPKQNLQLLRADSHQEKTLRDTQLFFGEKQLDFLFIDGDHTYEGVKQDYEMYAPMVRKGGIIAFHDIVEHRGSACKVDQFWHEVKQGYTHKEFVNSWDQGHYGIGLLYN